MLLAIGWVKIQSSQSAYQSTRFEDLDDLDDSLAAADKILYQEIKDWLKVNDSFIKWQFTDALNNECGILQFHASRNHRSSMVWELIKFISEQSLGSYGAVYIHDDEDEERVKSRDFRRSFRVWRILDGKVTEHDDTLFSPFASPHAFEL